MCLIVDASVAVRVFTNPLDKDFGPIYKALEARRELLVYGGKLAAEYAAAADVLNIVNEFERAGSARQIPSPEIDREFNSLRKLGSCRSNDPHVIALARASGARLLCSGDGKLNEDFKNRKFVQPRGKIYKRYAHRTLIGRHCSGCR